MLKQCGPRAAVLCAGDIAAPVQTDNNQKLQSIDDRDVLMVLVTY